MVHAPYKLGLVTLVLVGCSSRDSTVGHPTHLTFGDRRVSFDVPPGYEQSHNEHGTITLVSHSPPNIELKIDVQDLGDPAITGSEAESFVRFQAAEIGAEVHQKGTVIYFVESSVVEVNGETAINTHWQVAIGDFLIIMTSGLDLRDSSGPVANDMDKLTSVIIDSIVLK